MIDHPKVRNSLTCPMCYERKSLGLVACWRCYNAYGMKYGNVLAEAALDSAEEQLTEWRA